MTQARLLVVEDLLNTQQIYRAILERAGYQVSTASDYDEAIALADSSIDLALVDISLLGGKSGIEVLKYIRLHHPNCPVIMVSAFANKRNAIESLREGAADYLEKPVEPDELPLVVQRWLSYRFLQKENVRLQDYQSMHEAIQQSEAKFRAIFEASPVPLALNDKQGNFVYINKAFMEATGYMPADIPTLNDWWLRAYPDQQYRQCVVEAWQANMETAMRTDSAFAPIEQDIRCKEGSTHVFNVSAAPLQKNFAGNYLLVLYDITERKLAEAVLEKKQAQHDEAQRIAHLGHWEFDLVEKRSNYSDECYRIFGLEIGTNFTNDVFMRVVHPADRDFVNRKFKESVKNRTSCNIEYRLLMQDGSIKWLNSRWNTTYDEDESPILSSGTVLDITERKVAESQLRELNEQLEVRIGQRTFALTESMHKLEEKELSKSRFFAAAGHDLRQPLAAANLFIDALKSTDPTTRQNTIIRQLGLSMATFNGLLDALLNISKLDSGAIKPEYAPIKVTEVFNWLDHNFAPIAVEKQLGFKLYFPMRETLVALGDIGLLNSILMNLVSNAIKFTSKGAILVSARKRGTEVLFQIWDTGMGIAEENIEHIFEEFYQINNPKRNRVSGLGLGLAIAKRAAILCGCEITCRSQIGRGSVFGFSLPLSVNSGEGVQPCTIEAGRGDVTNMSFVQGKRFIVLEDDLLVAQALIDSLEGLGAEVKCFHSAEEALRHSNTKFADCYIVDYMLGGALNGIQYLNLLHQNSGKPINAVVMTGDTSTTFMREVRKFDWPVLHKPVNTARLISSLSAQEA